MKRCERKYHENAEKSNGYLQLAPRKPWITSEIMELIKQRNKFRKTDETMYRITKNRITQKCREAKEKWMKGICQDIQYNLSTCYIGRAYNIIKKVSRNPKIKNTVVKNRDGNILIGKEEITMRWKEYLQDLNKGINETTENKIEIE